MKNTKVCKVLGLALLLITLAGCRDVVEKDLPVKITETPPSEKSTSESNAEQAVASTKETEESHEINEEDADLIPKIIGQWELKTAGEEGYRLIISENQFQFYALYDGHIVPPNNQDVRYDITAETNQKISSIE